MCGRPRCVEYCYKRRTQIELLSDHLYGLYDAQLGKMTSTELLLIYCQLILSVISIFSTERAGCSSSDSCSRIQKLNRGRDGQLAVGRSDAFRGARGRRRACQTTQGCDAQKSA